MMNKITVIEIDYHAEVLQNLLNLFEGYPIEINLITTKQIWKKVSTKNKRFNVFCLDNKKDIKHIFDQHKHLYEEVGFILFNTLNSKCKFFNSLEINCPIVVRVHNSNTFFVPLFKNYTPTFTFFYIWKDFSHFLRKTIFQLDAYYRKKFLRKVDLFSFFSNEMIDYAIENEYLEKDRVLFPSLPSVIYKENDEKKLEKEVLHISIIGSVDRRRRNYNLFLDAVYLIKDKISTPIHFHLLGKANNSYAKKIIHKLNLLDTDNIKISSYENFVEQDVFDETLLKTDLLINPIYEKTRHTVYTELYGKTKISGGINDMIKYGIPLLIPRFYPVPKGLENCMFTFKPTAESLANKLIFCINNKNEIKMNDITSFNLFTDNKMKIQLGKSLEAIKKNSK